MKALLIGGTGNISLAVSKRLLATGWEVTLLNRGGEKNALLPGAEHIRADVNAQPISELKQLLAGRVFDAAADFIAYEPRQVERDIALFKGVVGQYLFVSTAAAYKRPALPTLESTPLENPFWDYARQKIACEERLLRERDFPVTVVRPSHTYGDAYLPLSVHGKNGPWPILKRMLENKPVPLPGDGETLWTITHAEDFAVGFAALMGSRKAIGEALHITSGECLTWNQIYTIVADALHVSPRLLHVPSDLLAACPSFSWDGTLRGDKARCAIFDNAKIRAFAPDFSCSVPFSVGARRSVARFLADASLQKDEPAFDIACDRLWDIMESARAKIAEI